MESPADRFSTVSEFADALATMDIALRAIGPRHERKKSIAVLPFDCLGSNPDDSFWGDGLMEEVVAGLSKLQGLRVISRTSSTLAKRAGMDVRAIGQKLGVDYVLEGTVRRAGESIRVTAKLIDAVTDTHLWAERYTGTSKDVFELDDKLSHDIVQALNVTLTPEEHRISMAVCGPPSELSSVTPSAGSRMPSGEGSSTIHSCRARTCCSRTCAPIRASRR